MPRKCCVPNCRGNYDEGERISVFKFPTDPAKRDLWVSKIPRADFKPTAQSVVCAKHFSEQFLIKSDAVTRPDGTVLCVERTRPKLTEDAYPSLFPQCPSYLSQEPAKKRKKPDERRAEAHLRDEASFSDWLRNDRISSFDVFSSEVKERVKHSSWMCRLQDDAKENGLSYWSLHSIRDCPDSTQPVLVSAIRIFTDMHVEIFCDNANIGIVRVPDKGLNWLFNQTSQNGVILTNWTQFDSMLSHFASPSSSINTKQQLQMFTARLQDLCSDEALDESGDEDEEERGSSFKGALIFLVEQLKLLTAPVKRYSCETLLWAFHIFVLAPSAYSMIRNSFLTLPRPSYLKRLSSAFSIRSGLSDNSVHEEYLKQKCQSLNEGERRVILMLDEIHVANQMSYKQGRLEGSATNCALSEASTAQVFMISSLMSKSKDVVGIVPVKNMDANLLHELIVRVVELLQKVGYSALCLISDNNRVNRNAFTRMCGGKLQVCIPHPFDASERLFFLFDTVHIFKCIRNNWLCQKDIEKTFLIPAWETTSASEDVPVLRASFFHLRKLFSEEKSCPLKLAPALNQKSLFPTSTEKQSVNLMLRIFDQRNVVVLQHYEETWQTDTKETREFLITMWRLWNMLNVKHPYKHLRLRNEDCKPVTSASDQNINFISSMIQWLQLWQSLNMQPREGILSDETMTALQHTLKGLVELSTYLLERKGLSYVLLGKFQTDNLEFRFSQYRQMSGCNYHVSVQQVLEGEKKLRLMSVLKLVSASKGTLTVKSFSAQLDEKKNQQTATSDNDYINFLHFLPECDNTELTSEQLKALVFVTGYAVSKVLPHIDCTECRHNICVDKQLHVEVTEDSYTYLSALDRRGLTWPSDLAVDIITQAFKVFQVLVGEADREKHFLLCGNQRQVLMDLSVRRISHLRLCTGKCENCELDYSELIVRICKPAVNIFFFNNYSKGFCDQASSGNSARKLKTFTKRT